MTPLMPLTPRIVLPKGSARSTTLLVGAVAALALVAPALAADPHMGTEVTEARGLIDVRVAEMIWTIVVFCIFFGVLSFFVWPKVLGALKAREAKQANDLRQAEQARLDAEKVQADLKARLAEAHQEAQALLEQTRADNAKLAAQLKAQTESEITAMKQRAAEEIDAAKRQAVQEIAAQAAALATDVAAKILQREIQPQDQQRLVDESLGRLGEVNAN